MRRGPKEYRAYFEGACAAQARARDARRAKWSVRPSPQYLYIPLGGNRKGKARRYLNLFLTMLIGGLWHGADWTFVFWGALNGLALCIDKLVPRKGDPGLPAQAFGVVATFAFINLTWVFFRADTFDAAWAVVRGVATLQGGICQPFSWVFVGLVLLAACTAAAVVRERRSAGGDAGASTVGGEAGDAGGAGGGAQRRRWDLAAVDGYYPILDLTSVRGLTVFFVFLGLILGLAFTGENPFVYFQF